MIHITHGAVPCRNSRRISHALFLPEAGATRHLRRRRIKYVSLSQALDGHGDALTIDDATHGALRLALLARRYGHAVTWFVNGSHVEGGIRYYPFQISAMLDDTRARKCQFDNETWNLREMVSRRALRLRIKECYLRLRSYEEIETLIETLACCLSVKPTLESSLSTVGPAELAQAVIAGVDVQNHSWSHLNPQILSLEERNAEVLRNEEYLSQFRQVTTRVFALPFGQYATLAPENAHFVLLANRNLTPGHQEGNVINRTELPLTDSSAADTENVCASAAESLIAA